MDALMAAHRHRRVVELREMAVAISYSQHAPEKIEESIRDDTELQDKAAALGLEIDTEVYWE